MATYVNNLRLKEITTGDEDGTWGTSTNTNLELITDGFSYGTKQMSSDANQTFTMPDATADATRGFYLKITSAASLTATREVTLGPNTISKVWLIENSTTGSQIITIKQGSGATVNIANGSKVMVVTDGLGSGAAVINATPTETATGDVTLNGTQTLTNKTISYADNTLTGVAGVTATQTLTNKTLTSAVLGGITTTASGNLVVDPATQIVEVKGNGSSVEGQIKLNCHANTHGQTLKSQPHSANVTNTMLLPAGANSTLVSLVSTDTLTNKTINGSSNTVTNISLTAGVTGTLPVANGGTNGTTAATARASLSANALPILKSGNYTAVAGEFVTATAGSITITLPASPSAGDTVTIKDGTGAAATTTFTVARNGSNIASSATDLVFDKNFAEITMTYIDGTIGWSV